MQLQVGSDYKAAWIDVYTSHHITCIASGVMINLTHNNNQYNDQSFFQSNIISNQCWAEHHQHQPKHNHSTNGKDNDEPDYMYVLR